MGVNFYSAPVHRAGNEEGYRDQQKFFSKLRVQRLLQLKLGRLEQRTKDVPCPSCSRVTRQSYLVEKGVDVNIAVDMMSEAIGGTFDTALLLSGDGDFAVAVTELKRRTKVRVEVVYPENLKSHHLSKAADVFVALKKNDIWDCFLK